MPSLEHTTVAIRNVAASAHHIFGVHDAMRLKVASGGNVAFEVDYDETRHEDYMINLMSTWEDIAGCPQVEMTLPPRPFFANIVMHQPESVSGDKEYAYGEHRRSLGRKIGSAIEQAILDTGMTDFVRKYAVGEAASEVTDINTEKIITNGDPEEEARIVAELSADRFTFVSSDFLHLPLEKELENNKSFERPRIVAVKTNIPQDLGLPGGNFVIRSGRKGGEVDGTNRDDLNMSSRVLQNLHNRIIERLSSANISVAKAMLDQGSHYGFNVTDTDLSLAAAVSYFGKKQA